MVKYTKFALVISAVIFAIGCAKTTDSDQLSGVNTQPSPFTSPTVSSLASPTASPLQSPAVSSTASPASPAPVDTLSPAETRTPAATASPTPKRAEIATDLASARTLYKQNCAACHGDSGQGNPPAMPSLKAGTALAATERQMAQRIANGGNGMPAYKGLLSPKQMADLVRLIRQEFQGRKATKS